MRPELRRAREHVLSASFLATARGASRGGAAENSPARMEAVTQTARAARRYLGVLLSGDDAARKQLVFSPGRVSRRADVSAGEPARDRSEASGSRARASAPRSGAFAARAPAEGADAPRVTSRFAAEAATMAGERERPSSREGAKPSDLAEDGDARVVRAPLRTTSWKEPHFGATRWGHAHAPGPVGTPRSILAVGGAKRKRGERGGEESFSRDQNADALSRATFAEAPGGEADAPAATRRRLDLLRSVGVVKSRGGVPSTYNVSAAFAKETGAAFAASSPSLNVSSSTTASGRVKLVVRGSKGRIGAFRSPGATPRGLGLRLRAVATDPKIVRAELTDLPPDATDSRAAANGAAAKTSEDAGAVVAPPAFSFGSADAAPPSLALGAGSMRRSKSRKGREEDDDSLLGAALRDFNGGKTSSSSARDPKSAPPKPEGPPAPPASAAFAFGAPNAEDGDGAKNVSRDANPPKPASLASTGFTFGAAPASAVPAFGAGAAPAVAVAPSADAAAPFTFGGAAAPPGGGMSMGAGSVAAPAGRRSVRARRPGRR